MHDQFLLLMNKTIVTASMGKVANHMVSVVVMGTTGI